MSTPTRTPAHAESAAAAVNKSGYVSTLRHQVAAAATQRGNQPSGAPHKDEDEVYLDVLQQYEQNSVALIFCVDTYPNAKEGEVKLKDLDCAVADGRKAAGMLQQQGFEVAVFENEQVVKDNIERELCRIMQRFPFKSPTVGRLYLMLAGHGLKDDATGSSVFCCANYTADNSYMTSYPLDELKKKLQHIGLKHQCVHLDCCHAGGIFAANRSRNIDYSAVAHATKPVVQAITAVTLDEQALEQKGNGIFTKHLCEQIQNGWVFEAWGADVVTLSQVFNATRDKVTHDARESNGQMTPMHKDVLNQHLKEQCAGEMLFFRPGMGSEQWKLKQTNVANTPATQRGAAAPAPTLTPEMQGWAQAQNIHGIQALANALSDMGVAVVTDLDLLEEEDVTMICGALKRLDAKKFKKAVDKHKTSAAQPVKPVPAEPVKPVPVETVKPVPVETVKPVPAEEEVQAAAAAVPAEANEEELPPMSAKEAKVIEEALAMMANGETELKLSFKKIGDAGASKIADALPQSKLTRLYLRGNQIGDVGASKIAEALPQSKLTILYLRNNEIGDVGASKIADALPQSKLTYLGLHDNQIGAAVKQRLEQCKNAEGKSISMYL